MKRIIRITVNNEDYELAVNPHQVLAEVLREELRLTGVKKGCGIGDCGACTVLMDGVPVFSCLVLAVEAEGHKILTIEGISDGFELHPLQKAFVEKGAIQCGFCTPGMVLNAYALLSENSCPTEAEIRRAISGNLCRCTGYQKIVEAIQSAATQMREQSNILMKQNERI
jgi:carbon-monoxide dehydrogenase small subunit